MGPCSRQDNIAFRRSPELLESLRESARPSADPVATARAVLWIALAVRKLSEAGELSMAFQRQEWPARLHPRRLDVRPAAGELAETYALDFSRDEPLSSLRLCGLLIHCSVFAATEKGVHFTSHVEQQHGLYFLEWAALGQFVDAVCADGADPGVILAA